MVNVTFHLNGEDLYRFINIYKYFVAGTFASPRCSRDYAHCELQHPRIRENCQSRPSELVRVHRRGKLRDRTIRRDSMRGINRSEKQDSVAFFHLHRGAYW